MTRCLYCAGWIWPWQHFGFVVGVRGEKVKWHRGCPRRR
jgi:hypothetical protein